MTPTKRPSPSEYPPEQLPIRKPRDRLYIYGAKFNSLLKKHTHNRVIKLNDPKLVEEIDKLVHLIDQEGYNRALRMMDRNNLR